MAYVKVKTWRGHEHHGGFSAWFDVPRENYEVRICNKDFCECMRECCYQQRKESPPPQVKDKP